MRRFQKRAAFLILLGLVLASPAPHMARSWIAPQRISDLSIHTPIPEGDTLVIGILGGWEKWNEEKRGVRKFALRLRQMNLPGVHVETVENHSREVAFELVQKAFDHNRSGTLDADEKRAARIILYGQSFGGAAVNKLAHDLKKIDVPVLLAIQIDTIGVGDDRVPSNVRRAVNFYQRNDQFFIRGEPELRAEDPKQTQILGNYKYDYRSKKVDLSDAKWYQRMFRKAHVKMEHDPEVWSVVEKLVLEELRRIKSEE